MSRPRIHALVFACLLALVPSLATTQVPAWSLGQDDPDPFCPWLYSDSRRGAILRTGPPPPTWGLEPIDPSPFCPVNTDPAIRWSLEQQVHVVLAVWSPDTGHIVRALVDAQLAAGRHEMRWDARDDAGGRVHPGSYPCILTASDSSTIVFADTVLATAVCDAAVRGGARPGERPEALLLAAPWPNPFGSRAATVRLELRLAAPRHVRAGVYDAAGRCVRELPTAAGVWAAGTHEIAWDGHTDGGPRAPAGTYWVRVVAGDASASREVVLVR